MSRTKQIHKEEIQHIKKMNQCNKSYRQKNSVNKKPSYCKLFGSFFIPMAIMTAGFLFLLTMFFFYYKVEEKEKNFTNVNDGIGNRMNQNAEELLREMKDGKVEATQTEYDNYVAKTNFSINISQPVAAFYLEKDGEYKLAWDSAPKVYVVLRNLGNDRLIFWEADASVLEQEVLDRLYEESQTEEMDNFTRVELQDIYVRGKAFLPGKYDIYTMNYGDNGFEEKVISGHYEGTSDIPEGYEHIVIDDVSWKTVFTPMIVGTPDFDMLTYLHTQEAAILQDTTVVDSVDSTSAGKKLYMNKQTVKYVAPTGKTTGTADDFEIKEGVVISMLRIDLWKEYRGILFTAYAVSVIMVILLSSAIAFYYFRIICEKVKREEYRKEMTNALAHDLKSPLMVISGYAENLKDHLNEEKRDYYADSILDTVGYMNSIIANILELAKLEDTVIDLDKKTMELGQQTQEILNRYEAAMNQKELVSEITGECNINVDICLMQRVLDNLIGNAVKYSPKHGKIKITMNSNFYRVENEGHIDKAILKHIEEPYVKANKVRSGENGFGLGLTIVKNICELHGFSCSVSNEGDSVVAQIRF